MLGSTAAPPPSPDPPPVHDPDAGVSPSLPSYSLAGTTPPPAAAQHAPVPDAAPVEAATAAPVRVPCPSQDVEGNPVFGFCLVKRCSSWLSLDQSSCTIVNIG
jgi:hypothetical protein